MLSKRHQILDLYEQGYIDDKDLEEAMEVAEVFPDRHRWYIFIERFLLWIGVVSIAAGIVFFVAYNWNDLSRVSKLGLIELLLALSLVPLIKIDTESIAGKILMFGSGIILGALLALFGQIYQTGADTWQLFATWAVLLLPLAWIVRFEPLWILWLVLINASVILYFSSISFLGFLFGSNTPLMALTLLLINTAALAIWEYIVRYSGDRTMFVEFPALFAVMSATWMGFDSLISFTTNQVGGLIVWGIWLFVFCWVYRQKIHDLVMLTMGCLSALVVFVLFLGKFILSGLFFGAGMLFIAIAIVVASSFIVKWLKSIHEEWEGNDEKIPE